MLFPRPMRFYWRRWYKPLCWSVGLSVCWSLSAKTSRIGTIRLFERWRLSVTTWQATDVVVVGAAYHTILFSVTINIYILITINYRDTINHGERASFLSFHFCGEHFSSELRRRSDIHDFAVCVGVRQRRLTSEDDRTCRDK